MMTEHGLSRASGIDRLLCEGNYRAVEARSWKMVTGSEIQLDEANDLADKRDGGPTMRDSFSTKNVSTSSVYEGVRRGGVAGGRVTSTEIVDRRSVCGDRALATKGLGDLEDHGGGSQHSNLQKHQNAFRIPFEVELMALPPVVRHAYERCIDYVLYTAVGALLPFARHANGRCLDHLLYIAIRAVYRDGTGPTADYILSLISTVQYRGRELAAEVGFDIFDRIVLSSSGYGGSVCIVLSSSEHSGSVYSDGTGLTADHVLSFICTAQCMGRELAAEVGFDICGHILLSTSKYGGSVYRDGTGMTADHVLSLTPATQGIVLLVSTDQLMSQEFATGTGLATCDRVVFFSPLVVLVRLPTLVMKDVNRARVNCSMIAQVGRGLDDRLGRRHRYRLKLMGHVTAEDTAEASTTSDVEPGEGKPGLRFLEFKLLSGKTIILWSTIRREYKTYFINSQASNGSVLTGDKSPPIHWYQTFR